MNGTNGSIAVSAVVLALVFLLYACNPPQHSEYIELGYATYTEYCSSCHGPTGVGDGPVAAELDKPVPDLTQMTARFGGVFPMEYILGTIDGRHEFLAHGTRQMPIWGNIWRPGEEESQEAEIETQRTLNGLLYYMESIQRSE